jgi:hypothetical protein
MIYFIQQGYDGPFKIGYTSNHQTMEDRVPSLQVGNPMPLRLIGFVDGDMDTEKMLHDHFTGFRMVGEWFNVSMQEIFRALKFIYSGKDFFHIPKKAKLFVKLSQSSIDFLTESLSEYIVDNTNKSDKKVLADDILQDLKCAK